MVSGPGGCCAGRCRVPVCTTQCLSDILAWLDGGRFLLYLQDDIKSYYMAVCKVHKEQPLAQAPHVKRDCAMGANVEQKDVAAAVLQQLADTMITSGWQMCPQPCEGALGAYRLAKRATGPIPTHTVVMQSAL